MLKWFPENEVVYFSKKGAVDSWGIPSNEGESIPVNCFIKGSEISTPITSIAGKEILPSYTVIINFKSDFEVGDIVEIEGKRLIVLNKRYIKDISRQIIATKLIV